jgi:heme/copper-type cytochrome/quinol oxidase subunit 2
MKQGFWVLVCLLSVAVFVALAVYGWNQRFGGGEIVQPDPQAAIRVPYIARPVELGADKGPDHAVWKDVPTATVPLMHQVMEKPWPKGYVAQVAVQAFHDGQDIYFRLSWKDAQADMSVGPGTFADACSVALPMKAGTPPRSIMMGFSSLVNFWHWRADLDAEVWHGKSPAIPAYSDHHNPFEAKEVDPTILTKVTTAVTDLLASRPGALTRKKHQTVQGVGTWTDGTWAVVFKRPLAPASEHAESDVHLKSGKHAAAFAVWDGSNKDRGSRKSLSDWVVMEIAPPGAKGAEGAEGASGPTAEPPAEKKTDQPPPRVITVIAKRFEFTPNTITLQKGESVTLHLESHDVTHGLYLDGYGIRLKARPGLADKATFTADKTGRFTFRCSETCGEFHPYMVGFLTVEPNSRYHIFLWITLAAFLAVGGAAVLSSRNSGKEGACDA